MQTYGIIMAGGGGTRFWPLSRQAMPKQLLNLSGKELMINETIDRLQPTIERDNILIVTNEQLADKMAKAVANRIKPSQILREPIARNTAACIGFAAVEILKQRGDGIMCVFPADHHIADAKEFRSVLEKAITVAAQSNLLVTIGLRPTFSSTGYGYIRYDQTQADAVKPVLSFHEKPNADIARKYMEDGDYVWNSGMFIWKASVVLDRLREYLPEMHQGLMKIYAAIGTAVEDDIIRTVYPTLQNVSIDYGVLEKCGIAGGMVVLTGEFGWNDIGSWDMIHILHKQNENGNIVFGDANCINTSNSVVFSTGKHVSVVDMDDIVVVVTDDAVLVCRQYTAQNAKKAVEKLHADGRTELL